MIAIERAVQLVTQLCDAVEYALNRVSVMATFSRQVLS